MVRRKSQEQGGPWRSRPDEVLSDSSVRGLAGPAHLQEAIAGLHPDIRAYFGYVLLDFALAGILAVAIALTTIGLQAIRAALANPVKSLRTE